ncbi:hypothetical protein HNQ59_003961 [Chitinivorax tropicus]|uniref:Peptidase C39 domain-containing protein n=1 Tax=Chitinivorax tropicus TaxID=714531 RepID=A0A840MWD8_9PROT|nr:hypothetical protein [Chitinivorax tropicus]
MEKALDAQATRGLILQGAGMIAPVLAGKLGGLKGKPLASGPAPVSEPQPTAGRPLPSHTVAESSPYTRNAGSEPVVVQGGVKSGEGVSNGTLGEIVGGGNTFNDAGRLSRNGNRAVFAQETINTCGPTSCGMVLDTLGRPVNLGTLVQQIQVGRNGVGIDSLAKLLQSEGVNASYQSRLSIEALRKATADGNPAIVAVKLEGGGHAVVVDGITTRQGVEVVSIRDPWKGAQYHEQLDVFKQRYYRQGVIIKGSK